jgi:tRNA A37 N6-isopentenylltransferase MiaA
MIHKPLGVKQWYQEIKYEFKDRSLKSGLEKLQYIRKQLKYIRDSLSSEKFSISSTTPKWKIKDMENFEKACIKHKNELEKEVYNLKK